LEQLDSSAIRPIAILKRTLRRAVIGRAVIGRAVIVGGIVCLHASIEHRPHDQYCDTPSDTLRVNPELLESRMRVKL
jgi:hypothetical protein